MVAVRCCRSSDLIVVFCLRFLPILSPTFGQASHLFRGSRSAASWRWCRERSAYAAFRAESGDDARIRCIQRNMQEKDMKDPKIHWFILVTLKLWPCHWLRKTILLKLRCRRSECEHVWDGGADHTSSYWNQWPAQSPLVTGEHSEHHF